MHVQSVESTATAAWEEPLSLPLATERKEKVVEAPAVCLLVVRCLYMKPLPWLLATHTESDIKAREMFFRLSAWGFS